MKFNDLIDNDGGVYYKNIGLIKKEIESINNDFLSKKIISNSNIDILDESVTYCFVEHTDNSKQKHYRDYNERCTGISFYYDYEGIVILHIEKTDKITPECILAFDDIYINRVYKLICNLNRKKIITEIVNE